MSAVFQELAKNAVSITINFEPVSSVLCEHKGIHTLHVWANGDLRSLRWMANALFITWLNISVGSSRQG